VNVLVIKYFCDICGQELGKLPKNELVIRTSSGHDDTFHLCTKCIDTSITNLMAKLKAEGKYKLAEREKIMYVTIKGSIVEG
jgi:uncharacterized Fe-S cluster-containing protein